jgi:hypothetical protein
MFRTIFDTRQQATAVAGTQRRTRRVEAWRAAARVVWVRWEAFLEAPPEVRPRAFAAYVSALDAEAAAAAEIVDLPTVRA